MLLFLQIFTNYFVYIKYTTHQFSFIVYKSVFWVIFKDGWLLELMYDDKYFGTVASAVVSSEMILIYST